MKINFNINLTDKWLYSIVAFAVLAVLVVGVYAYNSGYNDPSVFGHSAEELEIEVPVLKGLYYENDASPVEYEITDRIHMSINQGHYGQIAFSKQVPHDKLVELCGDVDGCELILSNPRYDSASNDFNWGVGPFRFFYKDDSKKWTIMAANPTSTTATSYFFISGIDGDNVIQSQWNLGVGNSCYFGEWDEGSFSTGSNNDADVGMHLIMFSGYQNDAKNCELTLID